MLGSLNFRFSSPSLLVGEGAAAAGAGALLVALPAFRRAWAVAAGLAAGGGLAALAVAEPWGLGLLPLFLTGLAVGGGCRMAADLILPGLPMRHGPALLGVAGAGFCLGGCAAGLMAAAGAAFSTRGLLTCAALGCGSPAWAAIRAKRLRPAAGLAAPLGAAARAGLGPRRVVMAASLLLQASAGGLVATLMPAFLARAHGLALVPGLAVLSVFWLAFAAGYSASFRLPSVREAVSPLGIPSALALAGGVLLQFAAGPPGVVLGAVLLGGGMGALLLPAVRLAGASPGLWESVAGTRLVRAFPAAALLAGWPVGSVASHAGAGLLLVAVLGCLAAAQVALAALIGDYRFSGDPAPV